MSLERQRAVPEAPRAGDQTGRRSAWKGLLAVRRDGLAATLGRLRSGYSSVSGVGDGRMVPPLRQYCPSARDRKSSSTRYRRSAA